MVTPTAQHFTPGLPSRAEFGVDRIRYIDGVRHRVGYTRTLRPVEGELGATFRSRVDGISLALVAAGCEVDVDEELKAGAMVLGTIHVRHLPEQDTLIDADLRLAVGRPTGLRGTRGGRS